VNGPGVVDGLDGPCSVCGRVSGDHTLLEWSDCMGETLVDLPYEPIPDDIGASMRQRLGLPADVSVADHVVAKAMMLGGGTGGVSVRVPALLHEYAIGQPNMAPAGVAKILYLASPEGMRAYGRLIRDSANAAANQSERKAR
jgi:hypothetical protein